MKRKNFLRLMALLLSLVFFAGCAAQKVPQEDEASSQEQEAKPKEEEQTPQEPEPEPVEEASATLVAVGDNLLHNTISWDAQQSDGSYDFTPVYQPVKDLIQSADIAFLNQEVPLNGTVGRYPSLDAPQQAADAIVDCGFDIVNEASNHSLDKGIDGLMNTLSAWKARNMPVIGAFSTPEEAAQPCILERNGITFGFLGYTYGTNGIPIPEGKEYAISLIDKDKIAQDMALANERVAQLSRELEELRSRPVEVAVQHAEEEELEQARREAAADARVRVEALENELAAARKQQSDLLNQHQEMDQKLKEARQARRDAMDAQKAAREELKQTREALERARKELRASGNKEITQFGVYFEACQEDFSRMMGILHKLKAGGDDEGRAKLTAAGGALLGAMEKQLAPFREEGAASC